MNTLYEYISNGKYIAASLANVNLLPEDAVIIRTNTEEGLKDSPEYQAELAKKQAKQLKVTLQQLWDAATAYRQSKISAEGIIELKPFELTHEKPGAIRVWIQTLWDDYYTRKAQLEAGQNVSRDFSNHGDLPHSFLEAMKEIQGN